MKVLQTVAVGCCCFTPTVAFLHGGPAGWSAVNGKALGMAAAAPAAVVRHQELSLVSRRCAEPPQAQAGLAAEASPQVTQCWSQSKSAS
jgi:hypothetical protein